MLRIIMRRWRSARSETEAGTGGGGAEGGYGEPPEEAGSFEGGPGETCQAAGDPGGEQEQKGGPGESGQWVHRSNITVQIEWRMLECQ